MTKFLVLILATATLAACSNKNGSYSPPPDIAPDARIELDKDTRAQAGTLDAVLAMGERNLAWLKHINSKLSADKVISFSSPATMSGYPMDKPNRYSDKIALARFDKIKAEMPREMYEVIIDGKPFTDQPPVELQSYLDWGLKIDKVYQTGARWLTMQPYLSYLANRRVQDIRGHYFLSIEPDLAKKLADFKALPTADHDRLKQWLVLLCFNNLANDALCEKGLADAEAKGTVAEYFAKYNPKAKTVFENFMKIQGKRSDIVWNSTNPNVINFPFLDPNNDAVKTYLKTNIEDEWKWNGWNLLLNFTNNALTHVEFEAGSTPHVNGIAGSTITMDANAPLTEYDVQWTIRHEFGHVLGFPDCYIEFYIPSAGEIMNYQIDTSNLMCSRMGKLQEKHYSEMKRVYYTK